MRNYGLIYIVKTKDEDAVFEIDNWFEQYVKSMGGSVDNIDFWGKKRLAYEIEGVMEGIFVFIEFTAPCETEDELERALKNHKQLLRHLVFRKHR